MNRDDADSLDLSLQEARILPPEDGAPAANAFRIETPDGVIYYAYRFPHPAVAATVVLKDRQRDAYLLIKRGTEPYAGFYAFPGGFLNVGRERIEETAARELYEETGARVDPSDLMLIDVRSDPKRDPRDHVFDISFYAELDSVRASPLDETLNVRWATAAEIETLELAFDHTDLWRNAKTRLRGGGVRL